MQRGKITNAFTLIELLAVIVLLAIIALIVIPTILDVVEDAKISAGKTDAQMILAGINNYCATEDIKYQMDNSYIKICTENLDVDTLKEIVNLGKSTIESIEYSGSELTELIIESNNHIFKLCSEGNFVMDDEKCPRNKNSLISKLLAQYNSDNTIGLVKDSTNENLYYYTGTNEQVSNNYLWYGGHQWRILEFDISNDTLTLITQQPLTSIQPANSVWKNEQMYIESYINNWLNEYFWNSLDSRIQRNILDNTFNIGIYSNVNEITTIKKVGLLDQTQYERAGSANSFLDIKDYWWLGNIDSSINIRRVSNSGELGNINSSGTSGVRAVIKISDIIISEGDGTFLNNFQVEHKATNTSNIQVGEYISVPYSGSDNACGSDNMCMFRVVSKNSDSIKVVLNGLISKKSKWAENASNDITISDLVYTNVLNEFIENIDNKYITTGTYGIEIYENGKNYSELQNTTITYNVGLPTIGELFSGNDIDIETSGSKTFVDINTLENPIISSYYWTMNRYGSASVRSVSGHGELYGINPTYDYGIRPSIYLKSGDLAINFVDGKGTAQSPYILQ